MSVVFSGSLTGSFTSDGTAKFLAFPSGVDYIRVTNKSAIATPVDTAGVSYEWQSGAFTNGTGLQYLWTNTHTAIAPAVLAAATGFYTADTTNNTPGALVATTGISNATPPVVTASNTGLVAGQSIVRIYNAAGTHQFDGIDFTVGTLTSTTAFALKYAPTVVTSSSAGSYRIIPYSPYFYPSTRTIAAITTGTTTVVRLTVTHNYKVGMKVRFVIPTVNATYFGMTELNGLAGTITAVSAGGSNNTITVDIDSSGFTAFAWPLTASPGFTPPQVVPFGENTAIANAADVSNLGDATLNTGEMGLLLMPGANGPAGATGNVMYWEASKSFNV